MDERLASWLERTHGVLTPAQAQTLPHIHAGEHVLLSSPTGSGKTLAAFLPILDALARETPLEDRIHCVYVSPLRALVNDMARNLAEPIDGAGLGIRVDVRTGDTPAHVRARLLKRPPHILVTTPESLALLLASPKAREHLRGLRWVVVDEVHAIAENKRGAQLCLTLERLAAHAGEFQRIGLSATVSPIARVAAFLGGDRPVLTVEIPAARPPEIDVELVAPDPLSLTSSQLDDALLARIHKDLDRSQALLVFTSTRAQAERIAARLKARLPADQVDLVGTHHGSMSKTARLDTEARLKRKEVRCVVASSSLELGIHAEQVDRVLLLGNPKSVARALQRVGRSGHLPGATARATLLVTDAADLVEAEALRALCRERRVEDVDIPEGALDVLAQHLAALRIDHEGLDEEATHALTRRAWSYRDLSRDDLVATQDALRRVPRMVYLQNAGTIPETGLLKVVHGETYVGEIEEDFAQALQADDVFVLGGQTWRFLRATPARVLVVPAKGGTPTVPAWSGEGISSSPHLARATAEAWGGLHQGSYENPLIQSVAAFQAQLTGLPAANEALAESFPTATAARALVVHAHLGRRANDALARALGNRLGIDARPIAHDAGFALLGPRSWRPTRATLLSALRAPLEPALREAIRGSDLLKRRFRHVATRGLMLPRRDGETLGRRQQAANVLLATLTRDAPRHPLLAEAWREALHDALDLSGAEAWRERVADGRLPLRVVTRNPCASPLAARILAPAGDARHEALRDAHDILEYYSNKLVRNS